MNWSRENLGKLYFEKFGLTSTPAELDYLWDQSSSKTITPRGDRMNVAVSPLWIKTCIEKELERTGLTLDDTRFKKVREEIIPAIDYALFLKKLGFGEHLITSSDSPDIVLINRENNSVLGSAYKKRAIPIEVTFIKDSSVESMSGADSAEKLVGILEKNKLSKSYSQQTTLLVVVDAILEYIDLENVVSLLKDKAKNFHEIDLWITERNSGNCVMACVYPVLATHTLNPRKELDPLMY